MPKAFLACIIWKKLLSRIDRWDYNIVRSYNKAKWYKSLVMMIFSYPIAMMYQSQGHILTMDFRMYSIDCSRKVFKCKYLYYLYIKFYLDEADERLKLIIIVWLVSRIISDCCLWLLLPTLSITKLAMNILSRLMIVFEAKSLMMIGQLALTCINVIAKHL